MFTPSYIAFFEALAENNNTGWFNENKKTYEQEVKKPFEAFIERLLMEIQQITPEISIAPAEAIFRINKDVRFSADKSPYKTEMSAVISRLGKKGNPCPGLYVNIGAEKVIVASSLKMLDKTQLNELRHYIADHSDEFESIIQEEAFKKAFGELQGDKIKRLPEEFKAAAEKQPLLYNTSLLAMAEMPATDIIKPDFAERVISLYKLTLPLAAFLKEPIEA